MNQAAMNGAVLTGSRAVSGTSRPPAMAQNNLYYKGFESSPIESRNWIIHKRFIRKEFELCKNIISDELKNSKGYNEYANFVLGLILRREGKIQDSLECFQKCHVLNPKNVENIKQVARSLYLFGRYQLAIEGYLEAEKIAESPDPVIYYNLGRCYLNLEQYDKAREYLTRAVQLGKTEESYVALAECFIKLGDLKAAAEIYTVALQLYPSSSDLYTEFGVLQMNRGDPQSAFDKFGSALAHEQTCTKSLLAAGSIIQKNGDYDVALAKYKVAAQYLPESAALWNNVGMCFFGKRKYVAAISCLKRANYLAPLDWKTLYNLGLVHIHSKQYASAFNFLSASIKLNHKHAPSFMLLANTLKNLDDPDNTVKAYEQAIKLDPEDPATRVNYGVFLHSISEKQRALEQLNYFRKIAQSVPYLDKQVQYSYFSTEE
ncbi:Bardet-Biedl syndrome 4 protein [Nilaparvata lugens]|uniref:Bardet-Biedl syndrome 4 protein n=1 Tax=Nilaparvata lugens TaxID=108931 RepID=UPI00193DFFD5|nr:Bardet-Biedl syndrome 4 protein [Nilaparvata lugens]XP_039277355.1 Bardet-Biedl syndrome 4 protein [Nilaparvata lugens]XP_039277356.1 Bardet-Biedl syndrome 4 protein [Nilaparvata lugens]XP_039277357.1 Bardet-Biedl syndrome 4 protein [Nilaparvata lugens]